MDLEDLTPAGASFRSALRPAASAGPVATFTPTGITHPDEIWSPRGSEIGPPARPLTQPPQFYQHAESERPVAALYTDSPSVHAESAAQVRSALRPGSLAV
jgi:hypothetical protein